MKKNHLTVSLLFCFFLLFSASLYAQQSGNQQGKRGNGEQPKATLKGQIVEEGTDQPLEYATITLFAPVSYTHLTLPTIYSV